MPTTVQPNDNCRKVYFQSSKPIRPVRYKARQSSLLSGTKDNKHEAEKIQARNNEPQYISPKKKPLSGPVLFFKFLPLPLSFRSLQWYHLWQSSALNVAIRTTGGHFLHIVFKAFQWAKCSVWINSITFTHWVCVTGNFTIQHVASGNGTSTAYFEHFAYLYITYNLFFQTQGNMPSIAWP